MRNLICAACLLALVSGCAPKLKFNETKAIATSGDGVWTGSIDPFSKDTVVKVEATSSDEPFHIFILKSEDVEKNEGMMQGGKAPPTALGSQLNTKSATFEITAPAGKPVQFYVVPAKAKANVTVKMNAN